MDGYAQIYLQHCHRDLSNFIWFPYNLNLIKRKEILRLRENDRKGLVNQADSLHRCHNFTS